MKNVLFILIIFFAISPVHLRQNLLAQKIIWNDQVPATDRDVIKEPSIDFLGATGNYVTAWRGSNLTTPFDSKPYFRRFDYFGSPIDLEDILVDSTNAEASEGGGVDVASVANGDFVVIWVDISDGDVYAQYVRYDGSLEGTKIKLYDVPEGADAERPVLALFSDPNNPGKVYGAVCVVEDRFLLVGDPDTVFLRFFTFNYTHYDPLDGAVMGLTP